MALVHGKSADHTYNSVTLDGSMRSGDLSIDVDLVESTTMGDSAKGYVEGFYNSSLDINYLWNPAASENDTTIFSQIGSGSATVDITPGGGTPTSTNPKYTGTAFVKSYRITVPYDGLITSTASYFFDGAVTRATA